MWLMKVWEESTQILYASLVAEASRIIKNSKKFLKKENHTFFWEAMGTLPLTKTQKGKILPTNQEICRSLKSINGSQVNTPI